MSNSTPKPKPVKPTPASTDAAQIYSKLLRDRRISNGAFKLFHALRSYRNKATGLTCPSQETLIEEMGFNKPSLKKWTEELRSAGYIWTEKCGQKHYLVYHFTTDRPKPEDAPRLFRGAGLQRLAVQKPIPPRGAETCTVTNPREPTSITKPRPNAPAEAKRVEVFVSGLVGEVVARKSVRMANAPSLDQVRAEMERQFKGAGEFAPAFHRSMTKSGWRDRDGQAVNDWRPMCRNYASAACQRQRGVTSARVASPSSCASRSRQAQN